MEGLARELMMLSVYAQLDPTESILEKMQQDRDRIGSSYVGGTNKPSREKKLLYDMYGLLINSTRNKLRGG